jgi:NAD(P)-dependent dehydrogenase (short-subunit alcohol dehydrogenase family)
MSANTDQPPQQPTSDAKIRGVALVTGGASGIGKACAVALANKGYQVALNYRTQTETADAVCRSLAGEGHRCYQADVTRLDELEAMVKAVQQDYGRIDVLINAAGRYTAQSLKSDSLQEWHDSWQTCMALNLHAPVNLCYLVAPAMAVLGKGRIINITSRGAFRGEASAPAYGAAKSALNSATQSLALALGGKGIAVYAIAPGWTETPAASPRIAAQGWEGVAAQSPLNRVGRPEEIAELAAFLASGDTEYLTGAIIDANGASYLRN